MISCQCAATPAVVYEKILTSRRRSQAIQITVLVTVLVTTPLTAHQIIYRSNPKKPRRDGASK
jgi:hypothetical protein